MDGFVKLYKKLAQWQWYKDGNTLRVFIDLLIDANFEDSKSGFLVIKRGQCLTSLKRISERTGLTYQEIRTSLSKLERSQEINKQSTSRNSIITINKYNDYQEINKQPTNNQQTINNIKEYKEEKEYKESISKDIPKKVFKKPTIEEITEYCNERNNGINPKRFYNFYESKGWVVGKNSPMKDWKACVRTWEQRDNCKEDEAKLPDWWDKDFKERERTEDEERQLQELIRGY